jgi:hypothetical protein
LLCMWGLSHLVSHAVKKRMIISKTCMPFINYIYINSHSNSYIYIYIYIFVNLFFSFLFGPCSHHTWIIEELLVDYHIPYTPHQKKREEKSDKKERSKPVADR